MWCVFSILFVREGFVPFDAVAKSFVLFGFVVPRPTDDKNRENKAIKMRN